MQLKDISKMTCVDLKEELAARGLVSGNAKKSMLLFRLIEDIINKALQQQPQDVGGETGQQAWAGATGQGGNDWQGMAGSAMSAGVNATQPNTRSSARNRRVAKRRRVEDASGDCLDTAQPSHLQNPQQMCTGSEAYFYYDPTYQMAVQGDVGAQVSAAWDYSYWAWFVSPHM
jgi:hypothetical protein